ncbi:hemerythrin domain-containing protein [Marinobacterium arenosum]|uniref:hemerythrin domain-containing protein n=1 Tax=Marinobacterium arenosum TaxID=2862496 RepID=UPI001C94977E|nr:hemerythrin domain-containing protein [Marinobacterium arenosum]MBY4677147.1 hemerythrin domain-containing protein [Marinobacterium arenosum]
MKRAEPLKILSREHHQALVLSMRLSKAVTQQEDWQSLWRETREQSEDLLAHFAIEEERLLPLMTENQPLVEQLLEEHRVMRQLLTDPGRTAAEAFAERLKEHVRFEERELFPWLEQRYPEAVLREAMLH